MRSVVNVANVDSAFIPTPGAAEQLLTVADSVVQLTAFGETTESAFISVEAASIRCRLDGTNPTATVGHTIYAGSSFVWSKITAQNAKFIRITGTSGKLRATPMSSK